MVVGELLGFDELVGFDDEEGRSVGNEEEVGCDDVDGELVGFDDDVGRGDTVGYRVGDAVAKQWQKLSFAGPISLPLLPDLGHPGSS